MEGTVVAALFLVLVLLVVASGYAGCRREGYGPPPGYWRAVDHNELPDERGWPGFPKEYEGSSASAMSQFMMHSA